MNPQTNISNIIVAVRVRPTLQQNINKPSENTNAYTQRTIAVMDEKALIFDPMNSNTKQALHAHGHRKQKDAKYTFDTVLGEAATQREVFEATSKPLVREVLEGYNATVFAYGATGCGKTHTITGYL